MSLHRITVCILVSWAALAATARAQQCEDLPSVVGMNLGDADPNGTGEIDGRPYELYLMKRQSVDYEAYKNKQIKGQIPAGGNTGNGDPIQLTAGESMHLIMGALGGTGGGKGPTTTNVILVVVIVVCIGGWWKTWHSLKSIKAVSSGDDT